VLTVSKLLQIFNVHGHLERGLLQFSLLTLGVQLVVATNADEGESIADEHGLHLLVKDAGAAQRWQAVDLKDPWLHVGVEHDVEAEHLEAALLPITRLVHFLNDVWLRTYKSLDDDVVAPRKDVFILLERVAILLHALSKVLLQEGQRPLGAGLLLRVLLK
jgi:hypothetical protein